MSSKKRNVLWYHSTARDRSYDVSSTLLCLLPFFLKNDLSSSMCLIFQHRSTIGLACAQAVAIRGAPDAARRHASAPRALPLRVAYDDWDLNDFHERARA